MAKSGKDINLAIRILEAGDLVAVPTETVYGLAGNAFNEEAVLKIFEVKNRPSFDPLIVHVADIKQVDQIVTDIPPSVSALAERFWPGPLTILLQKRDSVPDVVTSGLDTVAVRVPNHPLTLELIKSIDFPLAAPSANPFGYVSPTTVKHVNDQLGGSISYILDGGTCHVGIESTIIGFQDGVPMIFRLGGIPIEEIEAITGKVRIKAHSSSRPSAPGSLESHYAPGKPVFLENIDPAKKSVEALEKVGLIRFREPIPGVTADRQIVLSASGDLKEAAKNLFAALRSMDEMDVESVIAEPLPEKGLGRAINDRLRRAAAKKLQHTK